MAYSWISVGLRDGHVIAPLPTLTCETVGARICNYQTATGSLPVGGVGADTPPVDWLLATLDGGAALVIVDDPGDGTQSTPVWGGYVVKRTRDTGDTVGLDLATLEAYLDTRYVGDVTYTATDQNTIVSNLISSYVNTGNITIRVQVVGGAGQVRDRTYTNASNKSVLAAITELSSVIGGPEWTIGWEWQHSPERLTPVLYVGTRIGTAVTPGLMPSATFEAPGSIVSASLMEDYSAGKGANSVTAQSSGVGAATPLSSAQTYADAARPTFEYRFTPSTSITDTATLTAHAQAALAQMQNGSRALTMTAAVESAPRLGRDWSLGDDIGYVIGGLDQNGNDTVPAFPGGFSGTARALGWDLMISGVQTVTPILGGV